jgi:hypothetical protein
LFEITLNFPNFEEKRIMVHNTAYTKCPKCEAKYSYTALISEKTSGAEVWSDGFCMALNRMDIIDFAKCPVCSAFFWIQDNSIQEPTDLSGITNLNNTWSLDDIGKNELDFIKEAFKGGLGSDTKNEIRIRIKLWQLFNHILRKFHSKGFFEKLKQKLFESPEYKEAQKQYSANISHKLNNLIRLTNLMKLDITENANFLLFAEIYRELGDYNKAMIFCYKAETSNLVDHSRIMILKQHITNKSKVTYRI